MIISYTAICSDCGAENRLPLTNQDIPREQVRMDIFKCGGCNAGFTSEDGRSADAVGEHRGQGAEGLDDASDDSARRHEG